MKSLLVLTAILTTSYAQATLVVGDMVRYNLSISSPAYQQVIEHKIEVVSISAQLGTYTTKITESFNGTEMSQSTESSDLNTANESENILDHCLEMPTDMASIETVTVPAGTFKVCHIKTDQSGMKTDQYMGKVLFGLVKSVNVDSRSNTTTSFELVEVKKN